MDTSKEYIDMCSKATEIQEYYEKDHTVNIALRDFVYVNNINAIDSVGVKWGKEVGVWIPRQDQLQEMIDGELSDKIDRFYAMFFKAIVTPIVPVDIKRLESMQKQLSEAMNQASPLLIFNAEDDVELIFLGNCKLGSMEQMWISFVMKEKYNKTWNKETKEWILKKS